MINNTTVFHFVPGCEGENFAKRLRCKEESPIMEILNEALLEDDLIKFGIVLYAYADTFAHQGFSGLLSKVNDIKNCEEKNIINKRFGLESIYKIMKIIFEENFEKNSDRAIPAYGHGQALTYPDIPYLEWEYEYDYTDEFSMEFKKTEINNKKRYKRAFEEIKNHLEVFLDNHPKYRDTKKTKFFNHYFSATIHYIKII